MQAFYPVTSRFYYHLYNFFSCFLTRLRSCLTLLRSCLHHYTYLYTPLQLYIQAISVITTHVSPLYASHYTIVYTHFFCLLHPVTMTTASISPHYCTLLRYLLQALSITIARYFPHYYTHFLSLLHALPITTSRTSLSTVRPSPRNCKRYTHYSKPLQL